METLHDELARLRDEVVPTLLELEQWERIVSAEEREYLDEDCTVHDGCRVILHGDLPGRG